MKLGVSDGVSVSSFSCSFLQSLQADISKRLLFSNASEAGREVARPRGHGNLRFTKAIPGTVQEGGASFQTTHWTVVLQTRETESEEVARQALSGFCEAYWPPLYSFLRHRGYSSADAQDLVQGFFAHLLEQNTLSRADREKGRLRTFLLTSLQNFLVNEYNRARALKRGGGRQMVSIEEYLPEAEAAMSATSHLSDTGCYDLVWASGILSRAWQNLQNAFVAEGKAEQLEELRPFVTGGSVTPPSQEKAAARLGVPIATLRTWLSRLRQRYRESLRMEVASTVSDPADVDQELRYLCQLLVKMS
jgi:RNA polymerase sigma-70 factor (ECF subfamily)